MCAKNELSISGLTEAFVAGFFSTLFLLFLTSVGWARPLKVAESATPAWGGGGGH